VNNNKGFTEQSVEPSSPNTLLDRVSYAKTLWASAFAGHMGGVRMMQITQVTNIPVLQFLVVVCEV
jgi:hypothetical protein